MIQNRLKIEFFMSAAHVFKHLLMFFFIINGYWEVFLDIFGHFYLYCAPNDLRTISLRLTIHKRDGAEGTRAPWRPMVPAGATRAKRADEAAGEVAGERPKKP